MKRKGLLITCGAVLAAVLLFGCDLYGIQGNGNIVSQERTAAGFDRITAYGSGYVNVYFSENYKVIVTTDSNIQDMIGIESRNSTLYIENKNGIYNPTKLTVDVYLPELKEVTLRGSGSIKVDHGSASNFEIKLSGSGRIDTQNYQVQSVIIDHSGSGYIKTRATDSISANLSGSGSIDAQNYQVQNAHVTVSGSGSIRIWVLDSLTGRISGSGSILYKGSPSRNIDKTGSGNIRPL